MKTDRKTNPKAKGSTPEKIEPRSNAEFKEHIRQLNGDKATITGASHAHPCIVRSKNDIPLKWDIITGDVFDDSFIDQLKVILPHFGITVTDHPSFKDSDELGLILSNRPLTEEELGPDGITAPY